MVQNARITVFTVYELLSENRQGELKLCPLPAAHTHTHTQIRVKRTIIY